MDNPPHKKDEYAHTRARACSSRMEREDELEFCVDAKSRGYSSNSQPGNSISVLSYTNEQWFEEMGNLRDLLEPEVGASDQLKIAIIDTGLNVNQDVIRSQIEFRDFVEPENTGLKDGDRHGTEMFMTIREVMREVSKNVEFLVARAWETQKIPSERPKYLQLVSRITEAITWVGLRKVDIILMSWGFSDDEPRIRSAIEGIPGKPLIAVASGNFGASERVLFPARMELDGAAVTAVFSATSFNKNSRQLNHPPLQGGNNLAILGEDVLLRDPTNPAVVVKGKKLTGTSVAAAIFAGFAGFLLLFARCELSDRDDGRLRETDTGKKAQRRLRDDKRRINLVFKAISSGYVDEGYRCLTPGQLLEATKLTEDASIWFKLTDEQRRARVWNLMASIVALEGIL